MRSDVMKSRSVSCWVDSMLKTCSKEAVEMAAMVLWSLWNNKNTFVWRKKG
ncbi:hypothetical protein Syun_028077 [Stephania yunnanensis]|uniref:Uncharacterized protein n=1 Tax=Stephania yunnanensis TaxID=152371 RepID=A0AAP0HQT2_9MAGN